MSQALVSVIIPAFNAALCLERCLKSVFHQTHKYIEVIVVDDGSTDKTADILHKYLDRITFASQANRGPSAARNHGLSLARGEFVAFLDADDYWLPDFLSRCLEFLEQHPEAIAVSTGQQIISWNGEVSINPPLLRGVLENKEAKLLYEFFAFWAEQNHIHPGCCVFRKTIIDRAGSMREDLRVGEDWEYSGYLGTFGTWGFIPEVLWVSESASHAAAQGLFARNRLRGKTIPTVEDWQQRIVPRLTDSDWEGFRVVRGRVAQAFVYAKLLGGDIPGARDIAQRYGPDFPVNRVARLFRWLAPRGLRVWRVMALALLGREATKGWRLHRAYSRSQGRMSQSTHKVH